MPQPAPAAPVSVPPLRAPVPAVTAPQAACQPTIRAQSGEEHTLATEPRPAPLKIPSPEQLGITSAVPVGSSSPDWGEIHRRLARLGAICLHQEKLADGSCRFSCVLPTSEAGRVHRVEARAATDAQAALLVVESAETWARVR
jgi:hypothetical protein